jgi:hypothetical protein
MSPLTLQRFVQVDQAAQAQTAQLPCAPASFVAALLVQRCADKHSAVSSRAMAGLSKCLGELLSRDRSHHATIQWLSSLTHALCHSNCLVFAADRLHAHVNAGGTQPSRDLEADASAASPRPARCTPWPYWSVVFANKVGCTCQNLPRQK